LGSQQKFEAARAAGFFDAEITTIALPPTRKEPDGKLAADEHPRPQTTAEQLAKLRPLNQGGVVTAGNASGINDGAGAIVVGSRAAGEKAGGAPRGRVGVGAVAGIEPRVMGLGPVPAAKKALERAGLTLK